MSKVDNRSEATLKILVDKTNFFKMIRMPVMRLQRRIIKSKLAVSSFKNLDKYRQAMQHTHTDKHERTRKKREFFIRNHNRRKMVDSRSKTFYTDEGK